MCYYLLLSNYLLLLSYYKVITIFQYCRQVLGSSVALPSHPPLRLTAPLLLLLLPGLWQDFLLARPGTEWAAAQSWNQTPRLLLTNQGLSYFFKQIMMESASRIKGVITSLCLLTLFCLKSRTGMAKGTEMALRCHSVFWSRFKLVSFGFIPSLHLPPKPVSRSLLWGCARFFLAAPSLSRTSGV